MARATKLECLRRLRDARRRLAREGEFERVRRLRRTDGSRAVSDELHSALAQCVDHVPAGAIERAHGKLARLAQECGVPAGTLYRRVWEARRAATPRPRRRGPPPARPRGQITPTGLGTPRGDIRVVVDAVEAGDLLDDER